jgi:hypothetical protein
MTISTTCPGCKMPIAAPESTAGHRARCPHCGAVVLIPAAVAAHAAVGGPAATGVAVDAPLKLMAEAVESPSATPSRLGGHSSAFHSSATTVDRMLARTSPYGTLRVLAVVHFGVGIAIGIHMFGGGLVGLIILSMSAMPLQGILVFIGGLVMGLLSILVGRTISEVLRLCADVGDRARQSAALLEDCANKMKE